jgi:hypothetical protein
MGQRHDEIRVNHLTDIHEGIALSELVIFENSGDTPFHDEREQVTATANDFLGRVEHEAP